MPLQYPLVHVDKVQPENMKPGEGWAISEFRLPISGRNGGTTTIFHSIFRPGSTHAKHLHSRCDEIAVYLKGHGVVGQGAERTEVRPGHCRLMPRGSEHFFFNETRDQDGLVIGFYVGATSVADTGYEFRGNVTPEDLRSARGSGFSQGILVHIADVPVAPVASPAGWRVADFRLPIGRHNGSGTALYWARLAPGEGWEKHRLERCDTIYYVISGEGRAGAGADRAAVRGGHSHFVPKGVERFLVNTSPDQTLEVIGLYLGAGSVEEAGYVHCGALSAQDRAG